MRGGPGRSSATWRRPTLWAELQRKQGSLTGTHYEDVENTPFTSEEQAEIAKQLREIKEHVQRVYSLSEIETRALEANLAYLEDAARRLPRRRWVNEFARAMFAAFVVTALPPDAVLEIIRMVFQSLGPLIGHELPGLPTG